MESYSCFAGLSGNVYFYQRDDFSKLVESGHDLRPQLYCMFPSQLSIILSGILLLSAYGIMHAQPFPLPHAQRLHAHNDYAQALPFWNAWAAGVGSIEADLYWSDGSVYVAHDPGDLEKRYRLDSFYFAPIRTVLQRQNGRIYAESGHTLHLLIDIKNARDTILEYLLRTAEEYPDIFRQPSGVDLVLSGDRPEPETWSQLPAYIQIDGRPGDQLTDAQWEKVAWISTSFRNVARWNGKGQLTPEQEQVMQSIIAQARRHKKPLRFWATPDTPSSWQFLVKHGVDIIGTDAVDRAAEFVGAYAQNMYQNDNRQPIYLPEYPVFAQAPKNVILLIGDGTGMSHLYAGYTANGGQLSLFGIRHTGHIHTRSADAYCTDSASGATAFATGQKTDNRKISISPQGQPLPLLTESLQAEGYRTGLITSVNLADATPSAFYARVPERNQTRAIISQLADAPLDLLAGEGAGLAELYPELFRALPSRGRQWQIGSIDTESDSSQVVLFPNGALRAGADTDSRLAFAGVLEDALHYLSRPGEPFFLVAESGRVDGGGHNNNMAEVVNEVLSLDATVGRALQYVDQHPETLLLVLADHETGGLTLQDGNAVEQWVLGHFSTNDHTGIAIPCFAYGPGAEQFTGVFDNTDVFRKIQALLAKK